MILIKNPTTGPYPETAIPTRFIYYSPSFIYAQSSKWPSDDQQIVIICLLNVAKFIHYSKKQFYPTIDRYISDSSTQELLCLGFSVWIGKPFKNPYDHLAT